MINESCAVRLLLCSASVLIHAINVLSTTKTVSREHLRFYSNSALICTGIYSDSSEEEFSFKIQCVCDQSKIIHISQNVHYRS